MLSSSMEGNLHGFLHVRRIVPGCFVQTDPFEDKFLPGTQTPFFNEDVRFIAVFSDPMFIPRTSSTCSRSPATFPLSAVLFPLSYPH